VNIGEVGRGDVHERIKNNYRMLIRVKMKTGMKESGDAFGVFFRYKIEVYINAFKFGIIAGIVFENLRGFA
jgi:hypothetical protein